MEMICQAAGCGQVFEAKRKNAKWCSDKCAQRAHRAGTAADAEPAPAPGRGRRARRSKAAAGGSSLEKWTRVELAKVRRVDTWAGQSALILAARIDQAASETASALATAIKEHAAAMDRALGTASVGDPVEHRQDEMTERRVKRDERAAAKG